MLELLVSQAMQPVFEAFGIGDFVTGTGKAHDLINGITAAKFNGGFSSIHRGLFVEGLSGIGQG